MGWEERYSVGRGVGFGDYNWAVYPKFFHPVSMKEALVSGHTKERAEQFAEQFYADDLRRGKIELDK